jgi:hypothetical protein
MNEATSPAVFETSGNGVERSPTAARPALRAVQVLLPVWGLRFIQQFLEFSLPSLLAPGNVPALAAALPCKFVILTRQQDIPLFTEHPAWQHLASICQAEFKSIDDLITDGNHSATITLAYSRTMREAGEDMLDTCFIPFCSDFIISNGSLANVLSRIQAGASGVLVGNFQVIAEDAIPVLRRMVNPSSPALAFSARELIAWSIEHLHPATVANMVNFRLSHNSHTNRLFWRVDENTLLGRFYLMHVVAVRPEVADFVVGASFDYSFIPEMCPSNNVAVITDSDEYFVVEPQPRDHESRHLRLGPLVEDELAVSLSEWTTAGHRQNVQNVLVYHGAEIPPKFAEVAREAERFVDATNRKLRATPQPHRQHPYWIGSMVAHRTATRQALSRDDWKFILGETPPRAGLRGLLWKLRFWMFGQPPNVTPWHPRWPDYRLPLEALRHLGVDQNRVLVITDSPSAYVHWLTSSSRDVFSLENEKLLTMRRTQYMPLVANFDACLVFFREAELGQGGETVARIGPLLKSGGPIYALINNFRTVEVGGFAANCAYHSSALLNPNIWLSDIRYVAATSLRVKVQAAMVRLLEGVRRRPLVYLPLALITGFPLIVASYLANRAALRATSEPPKAASCSSVFMELRPNNVPLPRFEIDKGSARAHGIAESAGTDVISERSEAMLERLALGAQTGKTWNKGPRQLSRLMTHYRFIAKLLANQNDIAEVGYEFATRIVLRDAKKVAAYDSNSEIIEDVDHDNGVDWELHRSGHDILKGPLPQHHDAIFSLDTIKLVSPNMEDDFIRHLRDSLRYDHSILIIGSQLIATPDRISNAQPVFQRSVATLRSTLEKHFHVVLWFSIVDDVALPGVMPTADHLFCVCCCKK